MIAGLALEKTVEAQLRSPLITVFYVDNIWRTASACRTEKQTEPHD